MKSFAAVLGVLLTLGTGAVQAQQVDRASEQDAKAMLDRAYDHWQAVGREKALADFNNRSGSFIDRDLYVYCFGADRVMEAHGVTPALLGKTADSLRDANGKAFGTEVYDRGIADGSAQVDYKWTNQLSKKIEQKSSFVRRMAPGEVCAVGFYR